MIGCNQIASRGFNEKLDLYSAVSGMVSISLTLYC